MRAWYLLEDVFVHIHVHTCTYVCVLKKQEGGQPNDESLALICPEYSLAALPGFLLLTLLLAISGLMSSDHLGLSGPFFVFLSPC